MKKKVFGVPKLTAMHYALLSPMILLAPSCEAYIGPGAGLTAIGSLVALAAAILLAMVGFIWFPLKRLLRKMRRKTGNDLAA